MNLKLSLFGLFILCTFCSSLPSVSGVYGVSGDLSVPSVSSVSGVSGVSGDSSASSVSNDSEEDTLRHSPPAGKTIRLLPNALELHRIRHDTKTKSYRKARFSRRADIDDMMEHLLRLRRQSMQT